MNSRDEPGSFGLPEGEKGEIISMINFGEFMEVYTEESTYKLMTPDSIDPEREHQNVPWIYTKVSDFGASNPLVANTVILTDEFLRQLYSNEDSNRIQIIGKARDIKNVLLNYLLSLQSLIDNSNIEINKFIDNENVMNGKAHAYFPQLKGLDGYATDFLISAKRCIQEVSVMVNFFLPLKSKHGRIDRLLQDVKTNHQDATMLINVLNEHLPMCEHIYSLRNAQEHAATTDTPLIVNNFKFENGNELNPPKWGLKGQGFKCVYEEANEILWFLITFFEEVFLSCVTLAFPTFPKYEIVFNKNPVKENPVRYSLHLSLPDEFINKE
ncbi:hypothetical protein F3J34_28235 [Klebsiella sp. Ap-873]|uniref:Uncharacterized protein n=1 Tax=Cedecea neteri TaxID=158822 RepID=A0AAN0S7D1_9ENTR|nr:hypothetical protein [Cedecea neteri]AIR62614.1 hypothetical protein LH23_18715 [Cedecea neteri]NIG77462.1 hypothetical protein [Klebsiella sp. Ap-873]